MTNRFYISLRIEINYSARLSTWSRVHSQKVKLDLALFNDQTQKEDPEQILIDKPGTVLFTRIFSHDGNTVILYCPMIATGPYGALECL